MGKGVRLFRKTVSTTLMCLLALGTLALAFNVQPVKASGTIYINADGSISPSTAPISTVDNITYTLTGNINFPTYTGIVVQRSNIVINGNGFTVQGNQSGNGLSLTAISNVTIKNVNIQHFQYGIYLSVSSNNIISGNIATANNASGISAYSSNNNTISGNNATANVYCGILLYSSSSYNTVSGNTASNNSYCGIYLDSSSSCNTVGGNTATANSYHGILLYSSPNNTVSGNNATANSLEGIYLSFSSNNTVSGNTAIANQAGIMLYSSNNNTINSNNARANVYQGIEVDGSSSENTLIGNNVSANNLQGILLQSSSSYNTVSGNTASNNSEGIYLSFSSNNTVSGNTAIANQAGIMLYSSNNNTINSNNARANVYQGIEVDGSSSENTLIGNNVSANSQYGIFFDSSSKNTIYHNNFMNNAHQAFNYNSTNTWDNGYPSGGNYWSDYTGMDLYSGPNQNIPGSDGIGDTPYIIDSNNMDHYPLMRPLPFQSTTLIFISPNPVVVGFPVTCTARVSGSRLTGTVTWGTSSIGGSFNQSVCTLSNGTCSVMYTDNFTGSVTIAAYYSGDPNNMPNSGSTTLIVTSSGPVIYSQNYTSVQAAVNAAPSGATVIISPGFYNESLTLNKRLTIIGEKDPPVFGGGSSAIYLTLLSGASGSTVTGIEITNFQEGILVDNASNIRIYSNIMASIGSSGIVFEGSSATGNVVFDNIFQDTPTPINLTAAAGGNTVYGNIITSQTSVTLNIGANGNVVYGNSMSGNQIILNVTNSNGNVFYHNNFMATAQLTVLASGSNTWDNGYPSGGNYWSNYNGTDLYSGPYQNITGSDGIGDTPYHVGANSVDNYPLMKPQTMTAGHCVAVVSVVAAKTVIGTGFMVIGTPFSDNVTVLVANNGNYTETFNVTVYANSKVIGTEQVSLNAAFLTTLTFGWNTTTGLAYGNYTISAYAQPVPGQTDVSGNGFTLGLVKVTIPGDINGDFKVSLADLVLLANAYGTTPASGGNPGVSHAWNPNADIDGNGVVGLSDLVIMAYHWGQQYP